MTFMFRGYQDHSNSWSTRQLPPRSECVLQAAQFWRFWPLKTAESATPDIVGRRQHESADAVIKFPRTCKTDRLSYTVQTGAFAIREMTIPALSRAIPVDQTERHRKQTKLNNEIPCFHDNEI